MDQETLHNSMQKLTDVIVHDIFSPPVASRIYVYPSIAAYEVLASGSEEYKTLAGQLTDLKPIPSPKQENVSLPLASIKAFLTVGKALVFSADMIAEFEEELFNQIRKDGMNSKKFEASIAYGEEVAAHILKWASTDMYKESRTFSKYSITDSPNKWKPTPPDYKDGIEPHWSKMRILVLDSADQYRPKPPTPFDMMEGSPFHEELMEVYETGKRLNEERTEIAKFWDCNPYVSHHVGHAMLATKKITPGGHWIGITKIASKKAEADMLESAHAYALVSITLFDGFISCWDEKYNSLLVRPETLINEYIDDEWVPLLQTPPFPEYTSGHSVISGAASVMLTKLYGENFSFDDDTEMLYGLPMRSFTSFKQAADEAAISRLYGGIHYRPAIETGITQGRAVGKYLVENIKTNNNEID